MVISRYFLLLFVDFLANIIFFSHHTFSVVYFFITCIIFVLTWSILFTAPSLILSVFRHLSLCLSHFFCIVQLAFLSFVEEFNLISVSYVYFNFILLFVFILYDKNHAHTQTSTHTNLHTLHTQFAGKCRTKKKVLFGATSKVYTPDKCHI